MAKFIATIKAIITRLAFASHGFIAIWQVTTFKRDPCYWYLSCPILLLFFEGIFTVTIKTNQEWKWFCPSVFFYLVSVVPAIWLLELDKLERRMKTRDTNINISDTLDLTNLAAEDLKHLEQVFGVNLRLPEIKISTETWVTLIEQFLMLVLIVGRWMLPKGDLTRDQLSQLLLVYIGTAADIIEFFDSFKEERIGRELILVYLTLGIWSWSLMQFTVVLTATKSRKSRLSSGTTIKRKVSSQTSCCSIDVWAIAINMILQDAPFLAFRLIIIIHYRIVSYMNIFFTCKNTLVILLQLYRLCVVQSENRSKKQRRNRRIERQKVIPNISIISRDEIYRYKDARSGWKQRGDIRKAESKSKDFPLEENSICEIPPKHIQRSKRQARQDTGYSTSSTHNSWKHDMAHEKKSKRMAPSGRNAVTKIEMVSNTDDNEEKTIKSKNKRGAIDVEAIRCGSRKKTYYDQNTVGRGGKYVYYKSSSEESEEESTCISESETEFDRRYTRDKQRSTKHKVSDEYYME